VICQTKRNVKIKYNKDTRKIKNKFIFLFHLSYVVFCKGKPTVFVTAFDREPGFKTECNKISNLMPSLWWGLCVCVREGYNISLCHPSLGDCNFVVLLKTVLTFNHKTNDAIVRKILPKTTSSV